MRDLYLGPGASDEDKAAIKAHRELCGTWPDQTPEQVAHSDQVDDMSGHPWASVVEFKRI